MTFADSLESFFNYDDDLYKFDILRLHGDLTRDEKVQIIDLFVNGSEATSHLNVNVLCATSGVGNAGIDSSEVRSVIRLGFPHSILDMSQEKGSAGHHNSSATPDKYSYELYFSLESFLFLFLFG